MASLPTFLQHLKCFDGWKVQDDPKEAVKRYYEKHPQELKKKPRKTLQKTTRVIIGSRNYKPIDLPSRVCDECGKLFVPSQKRSRFCSPKCSGKYHSRKQYAKTKEAKAIKP